MDYEKLGAFYLGRVFDDQNDRITDQPLLYDAKDLTTHAVCLGMTGSGKTGLCVSLLEEAAIDGIPALVIDPKGDLGNLLLTFPLLRGADFRPWVEEEAARREGLTVDDYAKRTAATWKKGLADWDQSGARIERLRGAVDAAIYTPGSPSGRPLRVIGSLAAPSPELADDEEASRERLVGLVSALLSLLDLDTDPLRSREHILLSNIVDRAWKGGRDLDIAGLIREIQSPPFDRLGVLDLESFFPAADRFELAMRFNNLLASPGFAAWMEGEPLDVAKLLHTPSGRPRLSILSIAHLSESERMFFVTLLLHEVVAWMRAQPGTSSLRALLYMDEVFGYFPPTANPPSKTPMLTLLKQARAYGLGVVLATQNPVDLDYKGLSNTGTWFLGRLQTERDKARVLDGLEGASAQSGADFNRQETERLLAGLKSRVFLMNNVHDDRPVLFHSRWALSYLRGPLTRSQIRTLTAANTGAPDEKSVDHAAPAAPRPRPATSAPAQDETGYARPVLDPDIPEFFLPRNETSAEPGTRYLYRAALFGAARLHYVDRLSGADLWKQVAMLAPLDGDAPANPWSESAVADPSLQPGNEPDPNIGFAALPTQATNKKSYGVWTKRLGGHLYREHPLLLQRCRALKLYSVAGQSEADFRVQLGHALREQRDLGLERLRKRYEPKLERLQEKIRRAEERVAREQSQSTSQKIQAAVSLGTTLLGALFGRRAVSSRTVGRAATTARGMARAAREHSDVGRAAEKMDELVRELESLEEEFEVACADVRDDVDPTALELEGHAIRPRKSDIEIERVALVWAPWAINTSGIAEPVF